MSASDEQAAGRVKVRGRKGDGYIVESDCLGVTPLVYRIPGKWHASDDESMAAYMVMKSLCRRVLEIEAQLAEVKEANARHTMNVIEMICPDCGHRRDEDDQCANCMMAGMGAQAVKVGQLEAQLAEAQTDLKWQKERRNEELHVLSSVIKERDKARVDLQATAEQCFANGEALAEAQKQRDLSTASARSFQDQLRRTSDALTEARAALAGMEWLEENACDLRCIDDDAESYHWEVIEHYMSAPCCRAIGHGSTAADAIADAKRQQDGKHGEEGVGS